MQPYAGQPQYGQQHYGGQPQYAQPMQAQIPAAPPAAFMNNWYGMYYKQIQQNEWTEITAWFRSVDVDRSGSITANEIARCTFGGFPLGFETAKKLVRVFDKDRSGTIDFYEYAVMHKFIGLCQHGFYAGDKDRSGRLNCQEIFTALAVTQLQVQFPTVQALYNAYVKSPYGLLFSEFLQVASHIAACKSSFMIENGMQGNRGVIQIDFDKLVYMSATVV